jgi:hypothetical protein
MGSLGSLSSPGGGGGGGASAASSANTTQSLSLGNDVYQYGTITPAAPPGQSPSWLMPAIIGGVGLALVGVLAFRRK